MGDLNPHLFQKCVQVIHINFSSLGETKYHKKTTRCEKNPY